MINSLKSPDKSHIKQSLIQTKPGPNSFLKDTSQPPSGPPNSVTTFNEDRIANGGADDLRIVQQNNQHLVEQVSFQKEKGQKPSGQVEKAHSQSN